MACSVDDIYIRLQVLSRRSPYENDYQRETAFKDSIRDARDLVGYLAEPWLKRNSKTMGSADAADVPAELSDLVYHAAAATCCADLGLIEESKLHQEIFERRVNMFAGVAGDDHWNDKRASQ